MITGFAATFLGIAACIASGLAGLALWRVWDIQNQKKESVRRLQSGLSRDAALLDQIHIEAEKLGFYQTIVQFLVTETRRNQSVLGTREKENDKDYNLQKSLDYAGLDGLVTTRGYRSASLRLGLMGAAAGFLVGFVFSPELGLIGLVGGAVVGFKLPDITMKRLIELRKEELEKHLSEMLDVTAMALRSGLSFDRGIVLYSQHFSGLLGACLKSTYNQWSCGFQTREEALRSLAASFESDLLHRVVETIIRSLRFGTSLAPTLEEEAREARQQYRTAKQELVAKAPAKMMIPVTVLILPAMLLLVLGPVMLQLIDGF